MEWISVKDKLPDDYDAYYVVLATKKCGNCDKGVAHCHRLNFNRHSIEICSWAKADMNLVRYYKEKGDDSWDYAASDHWCNCCIDIDDITHWLKLPKLP